MKLRDRIASGLYPRFLPWTLSKDSAERNWNLKMTRTLVHEWMLLNKAYVMFSNPIQSPTP